MKASASCQPSSSFQGNVENDINYINSPQASRAFYEHEKDFPGSYRWYFQRKAKTNYLLFQTKIRRKQIDFKSKVVIFILVMFLQHLQQFMEFRFRKHKGNYIKTKGKLGTEEKEDKIFHQMMILRILIIGMEITLHPHLHRNPLMWKRRN